MGTLAEPLARLSIDERIKNTEQIRLYYPNFYQDLEKIRANWKSYLGQVGRINKVMENVAGTRVMVGKQYGEFKLRNKDELIGFKNAVSDFITVYSDAINFIENAKLALISRIMNGVLILKAAGDIPGVDKAIKIIERKFLAAVISKIITHNAAVRGVNRQAAQLTSQESSSGILSRLLPSITPKKTKSAVEEVSLDKFRRMRRMLANSPSFLRKSGKDSEEIAMLISQLTIDEKKEREELQRFLSESRNPSIIIRQFAAQLIEDLDIALNLEGHLSSMEKKALDSMIILIEQIIGSISAKDYLSQREKEVFSRSFKESLGALYSLKTRCQTYLHRDMITQENLLAMINREMVLVESQIGEENKKIAFDLIQMNRFLYELSTKLGGESHSEVIAKKFSIILHEFRNSLLTFQYLDILYTYPKLKSGEFYENILPILNKIREKISDIISHIEKMYPQNTRSSLIFEPERDISSAVSMQELLNKIKQLVEGIAALQNTLNQGTIKQSIIDTGFPIHSILEGINNFLIILSNTFIVYEDYSVQNNIKALELRLKNAGISVSYNAESLYLDITTNSNIVIVLNTIGTNILEHAWKGISKDKNVRITLSWSIDDKMCRIIIRDNGKGIDVYAVTEKCVSARLLTDDNKHNIAAIRHLLVLQGILTEQKSQSTDDITALKRYLVFIKGISTKEKEGGTGMNILIEEITKKGGRVRISRGTLENSSTEGTFIELIFPVSLGKESNNIYTYKDYLFKYDADEPLEKSVPVAASA